MKKIVLTLTAAAMLTGCSSAKPTEQEKNVTELAAVVTTTDASTTAETTTAVKTTTSAKTTTAAKTTTKSTTAKTTTAKKTSETSASAKTADTTKPRENAAPSPAPAPAEKHYTPFGEEISEAEWNAICKVKDKYGIDCEVVARNLCWETWPKIIIDDDGTSHTIPVEQLDPNEPLDVVYVLKSSDGVVFNARIKDNTDIITHDTYLYERYKEQLHNEAAGSLQKLVPGGKVFFNGSDNGELPFESPAEMTYDEFRQAFADNGGYVFSWVYVAEGMEVSDEMKAYSPRRGDGHPGEFGYVLRFHVEQVAQEDYDRLDDVFTEYPAPMESKLVN